MTALIGQQVDVQGNVIDGYLNGVQAGVVITDV
jgi:hypothetical protein